jgi:hypothetical protein
MRPSCCLAVYVSVCVCPSLYVSPLIFVMRLIRSPYCLAVYVFPLIFSFSVQSVSYQGGLRGHLTLCVPPSSLIFLIPVIGEFTQIRSHSPVSLEVEQQ